MTKTVEISRGMARKLERHTPLKFRLVGKCFVVTGVVLLAVLTSLWSQYLFPTMLDAHVAFDVRCTALFKRLGLVHKDYCTFSQAVLNKYDEFTNDWTFEDFELATVQIVFKLDQYVSILGTVSKMRRRTCSSSIFGM